MKLGSIFRDPSGPVVDPADRRLSTGTPESQAEARREYQRHQANAAIVRAKTEIPRSELEFGQRWIEHVANGDRYKVFGGVADYSDGIDVYYVTADGNAIMLERIGSRKQEEDLRAAREQRRAAKQAEQRERWAQIKAGA